MRTEVAEPAEGISTVCCSQRILGLSRSIGGGSKCFANLLFLVVVLLGESDLQQRPVNNTVSCSAESQGALST